LRFRLLVETEHGRIGAGQADEFDVLSALGHRLHSHSWAILKTVVLIAESFVDMDHLAGMREIEEKEELRHPLFVTFLCEFSTLPIYT